MILKTLKQLSSPVLILVRSGELPRSVTLINSKKSARQAKISVNLSNFLLLPDLIPQCKSEERHFSHDSMFPAQSSPQHSETVLRTAEQ